MPKLQDISALPSDAVELLGAVGYLDANELAEVDMDELTVELAKANDVLKITDAPVTPEEIQKWKSAVEHFRAEDRTEVAEEDSAELEDRAAEEPKQDVISTKPEFVNFEDDPEVLEMLALAPDALPLDPALIRRYKLNVSDIPEGVLLSHCHGDVEINLMPPERLLKRQRREAEVKRTGLMSSRIRTFGEAAEKPSHVKPLEKGKAKDVTSVSEGLNQGLSPESRRFVRGVLHPNPWRVRISAFFALLVEVMLVINFIGIPLLLYHEHASGDNMVGWVIGLGSGLVASAIFYVFWGISARCRVCGQRQFSPKKCLKNKKAHHIPVVGYIFPTAFHAVFFKWFYCTYCGTAVRLKR